MKVAQFSGIRRSYRRGFDVLNSLTFSIAEGEVVGLIGKNGAGKTTLIRIAMGLLAAQEGSVKVFGFNPRVSPVEVRRRIGYVSEDQIIPEFLRVEEVLRIHRNLFPGWDLDLERDLSQRFQVDGRQKVGALSRGQARQLALICAIAHRPELLFLDEPREVWTR